MKKSFKMIFGLATTCFLASCNGLLKVSFDKFKSAVEKIEAKEWTTATIKGNYMETDFDFSVDSADIKDGSILTKISVEEMVVYATIEGYSSALPTIVEQEIDDAKYYVFMGFRVVAEIEGVKNDVSWNKYGDCTKLFIDDKSDQIDLKASYKY